MPILQVFEPVQGSQFDGKYFVDIVGQGGPKLSSNVTDAKIMTKDECQAVAETWSAWHTFKIVNAILTPEQRLKNVAAVVKRYATPTRQHNGRGRMPSYQVDKHAIAEAALQLAEMVEEYLNGGLQVEIDDGSPF